MSLFSFLTLALIATLPTSLLAKNEKNPFKGMSFHTLKNGMKVVLAPNNKTSNIRIKHVVGFGSNAETYSNLQAGHVLEHMLFKDGTIADNKSYLELLREAGGDVNAYVEDTYTAYHTTIPHERGGWLIDKFKTMIFNRQLDEKELKLGKASVTLEIGKPLWFNRILDANPIGVFNSHYFPQKSFWNKEFGFEEFPFDREDERLSVNRLTLSQVQQVYDDYYYPSNMTLLIAGNFNPTKMLKSLEEKFGTLPDKKGKTTPNFLAQFKGDDLIDTDFTTDNDVSGIAYGRKLFNRSAAEVLVAEAYYNFVAHRLMIELRNKKGETYTAYSTSQYEDKGGYATVTFRTPSEVYQTNKQYLLNMIEKEAVLGQLSDENIKKAVDLFLKDRFEITDVDAETVMDLAETYNNFRNEFGLTKSPFDVLAEMSSTEFRNSLKKVHQEDKVYLWESLGPLFFSYDFVAILLGGVMAGIVLFGFLWRNKKPMQSFQVLWAHAASFSPGLLLETVAIIFISALMNFILWTPIDSYCNNTNFYSLYPVVTYYLTPFLGKITTTGIVLFLMKKFTVSVYSTGTEIVINQYVLQQKHLKIEEIQSVKILSMVQKYNPKFWFKATIGLNPFLDFFMWRKAVLITMNDGSGHLLFMKDAEAFCHSLKCEKPNPEVNGLSEVQAA